MTDFSDAIQWSINNVPMYDYDFYEDWNIAVMENLTGGDKLKNNKDLNKGLEGAWIDEFGNLKSGPTDEDVLEREQEAITPSAVKEIATQELEQRRQPRVIQLPPEALTTEKDRVVILPATGKAPEIPKPVLILPTSMPAREQQNIISQIRTAISNGIKRFLRR